MSAMEGNVYCASIYTIIPFFEDIEKRGYNVGLGQFNKEIFIAIISQILWILVGIFFISSAILLFFIKRGIERSEELDFTKIY